MKKNYFKILSALVIFQLITLVGSSQHFKEIGRSHVDTLSSSYFWGRGYTQGGVNKAADYLHDFFKHYKLKSFGKSYFQEFTIPSVNTFPNDISFKIDENTLVCGRDYIISGNTSRTSITNSILQQIDSVTYINEDKKVIVKKVSKLTFVPSLYTSDTTVILLQDSILLSDKNKISLQVESKTELKYQTENVIGYIEGKIKSDKYFVVTAHYDHIGGLGEEAFFPGANDNASGVAMLLTLIDYYSKNPPLYNIVFMAFSGEELGLLGSIHYVNKPLFPLRNIDFLLNLDLVGNGSEGMTVVNAVEFPEHFSLLKSISDNNHFFNKIIERTKAANSDHYPFFAKSVPCFFIYSQGGSGAYHDIHDTSENLGLDKFEELTHLVIQYFDALNAARKN